MKSTRFEILGTGVVARSVGAAPSGLGHTVAMGTRDPASTPARSEAGQLGTPSFSAGFESKTRSARPSGEA